jgi:dTDP-4-dehydrorhamnose reductase
LTALAIFGAAGQVGRELIEAARAHGRPTLAFTHAEVDISRADDVARGFQRIEREAPGCVVLNVAAYTGVDRAENDRDAAFAVNERGAGLLASRCAAQGSALIHLSTDYVFDGTKSAPYQERDVPNPVNVYGASKLAGEEAVRASCPRHLIVRCSSVFGVFGRNFVETMLRAGREKPVLRVVDDQRSCPTAAADIAAAALRLVHAIESGQGRDLFGTYHFCGRPAVTWHAFAAAIFELAERCGLAPPRLEAINAADYRAAARRPANAVLDCARIEAAFGIQAPDWRDALGATVEHFLGEGVKRK